MSQIKATTPPLTSPATVPVAPAIPATPATPAKHPFGQKAIIHLLVRHLAGKIKSFGFPCTKEFGQELTFAVACMPDATIPKHATGETGAVTCPLCLKTDEFKAQQAIDGGSGEHGDHPADVAAAAELEKLSCCG